MEFIFLTGMSGAGKSNAANAMEDLGFYCIDNIPPMLIPSFVNLAKKGELNLSKIAIVTDIRSGEAFKNIEGVFKKLSDENVFYKIVFLDAEDTELVRRYSETRRKHPLCDEYNLTVKQAVIKERQMLENVRAMANFIIDTTNLKIGQLKKQLSSLFLGEGVSTLNISCVSFGFKYGPASDANLVFDVRCLPNPFYIDELKTLTGLDEAVSSYVMSFDASKDFANKILNLIEYSLPLYKDEGKSQLVIAVGCTGGKHRSVTFAELIYKRLKELGYRVSVNHRDIEKK
ncbi:MAG: RNase adapter RapZ [Ruminococcaceae bacterium]|nr:RNase adapter RapZ [Oscillospiraceae bacterium]